MNVKERIKKYAKYENIAISTFEKSINVSNGYINSISKSIGLDKLELIIDLYSNLNIEWLLTGKGSMLKESNIIDVKNEVSVAAPASNDVVNLLKEQLKEKDQKIEALSEEIGKLRTEITFLTSESSAITTQNREVKHNINTMP